MLYTIPYTSPLGGLWLAADDRGVTGVWFAGEKYSFSCSILWQYNLQSRQVTG